MAVVFTLTHMEMDEEQDHRTGCGLAAVVDL